MTFIFPRFKNRARCVEEQGDLFFPEKSGTTLPAKRICNGYKKRPPCPAREECLAWALASAPANHEAGVWGGLSELERKRIAGYRPECGSPKGYKQHAKRREAACNLCREANAGRIRDYRQERRRVS
jgi:WhiB family redox-sensing transcriptional regulator